MIIVNKLADYSAVSIGTVDIPVDLRPETEALLAKYTKQLSNQQKIAVDVFVDSLIEEGLWSRLINLYMPILASNPSEALYNAKQNITHTVAQDNDYYVIGNFGLKTNSSGTNKTHIFVESSSSPKNVTFGGFNLSGHSASLPYNVCLMYDKRSAAYIYGGFGVFINNSSYPTSQVSVSTTDRNVVLGIRNTSTAQKFYTQNYTRMANGVVLDAFGNDWDGNSYSYYGEGLSISGYNTYTGSRNNETLIVLQLLEATDEEMVIINNAIKNMIDIFCRTI